MHHFQLMMQNCIPFCNIWSMVNHLVHWCKKINLGFSRCVQCVQRLWLLSGWVIKRPLEEGHRGIIATKRRTRTRLALELGVECEGILRHLCHCLLNLGVYYKQRHTMKKKLKTSTDMRTAGNVGKLFVVEEYRAHQ